MYTLRGTLVVALVALLSACGVSPDDGAAGASDGSGVSDAGTDAAADVGSSPDAAADVTEPDVAEPDAPEPDAPEPDAPEPDADVAADADTTADAPDTAVDAEPDGDASDASDGGVDSGPNLCGDGIVQPGEECDDANRINTDLCTNDCRNARCGDGFRNETIGAEVFESPTVVNPGGVSAYVCDDGGTCPGSSCDVANEPTAAEHGVCQALGYERALSVTWGGGLGEGASTMVHAYNWTCFDYLCVGSEDTSTEADCASWEMLANIECEGLVGEDCDDGAGNGPFPGACREDCTLPFCGDGITDLDEQCDDGNDDDADGCRSDCTLPFCGDGRINEGEQCDDGNDNDLDGCRNSCAEPFCGDGLVSAYPRTEVFTSPVVTNPFGDTGHVCDIGASCPGRSCELTDLPRAPEHGICQALGFEYATFATWGGGSGADDMVMPRAGNWACSDFECGPGPDEDATDICSTSGMLLTLVCGTSRGEECDDGASNSDELGAACRTTCQLPDCGDGVIEGDEECDDGNRNNDDLCTNLCELPRCGDGIAQGDEECDDANLDDFDLCRNDCTAPRCGDGVQSIGEECDLGAANADVADAACRTNCTPQRCGDGVVDDGEACDGGEGDPGGVCTPACEYGRCGDGIRQSLLGEQCDDGNRLDGDGCDRVCLREVGAAAGFIAYIGHDFFSTNDDVETLLGNAVFGDQGGGTLRVLAYEQFADRGTSGEVANVDRALDVQAAARGADWERTALTDWRQLDDALSGMDVLLVYEQETGGAQMGTVGLAWSDSIQAFAASGGRVIVMDYSGNSWRILVDGGIIEATGARTVSTSASLSVTDESSMLLNGVELPYASANGTIALQLVGDSLEDVVVYNVLEEAGVVVVVPF